MALQSTLLLVSSSKETKEAVSSALESNERFCLGEVCRNLTDLVPHIESAAPPAVLLDINPEPARLLSHLGPISERFSNTRFIVLSKSLDSELMLAAMQAGARHFMLERNLGSELGGVLDRLVTDVAAAPSGSSFVAAVLSVSGGCGATTVAVNLANELHLLASKPALLVDLDCNYGGAGTYLGLTGEYGIADVLDRNGELDPQLIRSTAREYSHGLRMLINPMTVNPGAPTTLDYGRLQRAIGVCRQSYEFIVIDAPRVPADTAAQLASACDVTLLILQMTVKDLASARSMLQALRARGASDDSLMIVVNRYHKRNTLLTLEDARKTLGDVPLTCLSNDYSNAIKGLNYGQPLAEAASRSALRRELRDIAAKYRKQYQETSSTISGGTHGR
jgi:pilus assembly protein CpaE